MKLATSLAPSAPIFCLSSFGAPTEEGADGKALKWAPCASSPYKSENILSNKFAEKILESYSRKCVSRYCENHDERYDE